MGEMGKWGKGEKEVKGKFSDCVLSFSPLRLFAILPFPPFSPQPI